MGKSESRFICSQCGYESLKWTGKCSGCGAWNTMQELEVLPETSKKKRVKVKTAKFGTVKAVKRIGSGMDEFDRVLGGGAVSGEIVVVGGYPGVGKSTLLLSVCEGYIKAGLRVLYFSAEESLNQVFQRAKRIVGDLEKLTNNLEFVNSNNTDAAVALIESKDYDVVIVDSVQAISTTDLSSVTGSVGQVRESAQRLTISAKKNGVFVVLVGHVTKVGELAGPMVLSHIVDAVFMLEGDERGELRILRPLKNRFGSVEEAGVFQMKDTGLVEVKDISTIFSTSTGAQNPGVARGLLVEGVRPMLVDVQALVSKTTYAMPKRISTGISLNRLQMLLAVISKSLKLKLQEYDVFLNIAGGMKINDPALDLPICMAVISSLREKPLGGDVAFIGEVGLSGEVRGGTKLKMRVKEARRLGMKSVFSPAESNEVVDHIRTLVNSLSLE